MKQYHQTRLWSNWLICFFFYWLSTLCEMNYHYPYQMDTFIQRKWYSVYVWIDKCGLLLLPSCKDSNNHCSQLNQLKTSNEKKLLKRTNIIFHLNNGRLFISLVTREARKFSLIYCFDKTLHLQIISIFKKFSLWIFLIHWKTDSLLK